MNVEAGGWDYVIQVYGGENISCLWHIDMLNNLFRRKALFLSFVISIVCYD